VDQSSTITRLIQALKGTGRFANPKARVVVSSVTTRDLGILTGIGSSGSVIGGATSGQILPISSLIDPSGNPYALMDIAGFADGATLKY